MAGASLIAAVLRLDYLAANKALKLLGFQSNLTSSMDVLQKLHVFECIATESELSSTNMQNLSTLRSWILRGDRAPKRFYLYFRLFNQLKGLCRVMGVDMPMLQILGVAANKALLKDHG